MAIKEYKTDNIHINFNIVDSDGSYGTSGQVLSRDAGGVTWINGSAIPGAGGTVTGSGVTGILPYWTNGPGGVLGDSIVAQGSQRIQISSGGGSFLIGQWDGSNNRIESASRPLFITSYTSPIKLGISGSTTMTIESSNVGIGTTSPGQKLQISGGNSATSATALFSIQKNEEGYGLFSGILGSGVTWIQSSTETESAYYGLSLQPNGGNVGIGTTSPAAPLDVAFADNSSPQRWSYSSSESNYFLELDTNIPTGSVVTYNFNVKNNGTTYNNNLVLDRGNVGIGITNPSTKLHVAGIAQIVESGNTAFYGGDYVRMFGTQNYRFRNTGGGVRAIIDVNSTGVTAGNLSLYNASNVVTTKLHNAGDSFFNGGNVGIGTTSPDSKLHVESANAAGANFILESTHSGGIPLLDLKGAASAQLRYKDELNVIQGRVDFGDSGTFNFIDVPNNSSTLYLKTGGNVGIGTTSPTAPLHIEGGTNSEVLKIEADASPYIRWVENGTDVGYLQFLGDNAYLSNMGNGSFFFRTNNTDKMTILSAGNVGIGTTSPSQKLQVTSSTGNAYIRYNSASYTGIDIGQHFGGNIYYWNRDVTDQIWGNNSVERMRITSAGNVGIGTDSPGAKLQVAGDVLINSGEYISWGTAGATSIEGSTASNKLQFRTSSVNRMIIDSSGNVGIGTTSPDRKLEVDFTGSVYGAKFTRSDATGSSLVEFANSAGVKSIIGYDAGVDGYKIGTASATNLVVKQDGNVGIGTGVPSYTLEVNGKIATNNGGIVIESQDIYSNSEYSGDDGSVRINRLGYLGGTTKFRDTVIFNGRGSQIMTIDGSSGNVGIGTTSPSHKLQVASDVVRGSGGNSGQIVASGVSNTNKRLNLGYDTTGDYGYIEAAVVSSHWSNLALQASGGNVGIGTATPSTKLQVNGRIKADEGVQVGNETSTAASLALVGTLRYRGAIAAGLNTVSVVEMCMQVSAGPTYAWKAIYTTPSW